jgi:hypothetical protein
MITSRVDSGPDDAEQICTELIRVRGARRHSQSRLSTICSVSRAEASIGDNLAVVVTVQVERRPVDFAPYEVNQRHPG